MKGGRGGLAGCNLCFLTVLPERLEDNEWSRGGGPP